MSEWYVSNEPAGLDIRRVETGELICEFPYDDDDDHNNAELIVLACNAHDDLMIALQLVRMSAAYGDLTESTKKRICAALAKGSPQ